MHVNVCVLLLLLTTQYKVSWGATTLEVDVKSGGHAISPNIYGMSFWDDAAFAKEIALPFNRWGGNAVTRYNWKNDVSNHASDWFFENIPEENNTHPENLPNGSHSDRFTESNKAMGARTMMTIGMIGWTPKDREKRCGFSVKKYGAQQKTDEWTPDCGNGLDANGKPITGNDPTDTSIAINGSFAKEWVQHLTSKYGKASAGGVLFYEMDNEYDLWHSTHRDVYPKPASTDDIIKKTEEYAKAVKDADPSALTLGPVGWGYLSVLNSGLDQFSSNGSDRKAHGDKDFGASYLKGLKDADKGTRLLDYFDNHIYPQGTNVALNDNTDPTTMALRLRSTRGLWDPTYVDESWIKDLGNPNDKIEFIPRMKRLVTENYPGTKLAITEYNWGGLKVLNGALTQADVLGIFGREGLDLAALWGPEKSTDPWAYAFRMYRNYDGKGSQFGDTSVMAKSSDQDKLAIYASTRSKDMALIVLVINKQPNTEEDTEVKVTGHDHTGTVKVYTYSNASLTKIVASETKMSGSSISYKFPAYSITLFEIPK